MTVANRLTTEFVDIEDRIRLSTELVRGEIVVLWLTQRLLNRLVPHLAAGLEKETQHTLRGEVLQAFAQQAAVATHAQEAATQPPVIPTLSVQQWLVHAVDVNAGPGGAALKFRGQEPTQSVDLTINPVQLRQWLSILRSQFVTAGWSLSAWPDWLAQAPEAPEAQGGAGGVTVH